MPLAAAASFPQAQTTQKKTPPRLAAKTVQPVQDKWLIGILKVEGNSDYTAEQAPAIAGIKVGDQVGRRDFKTAPDRLMATGVFESVGYGFEPDGTKNAQVATFRVAEVTPVFPIHFENLGAPDEDPVQVLRQRDPRFSAATVPDRKPVMERYAGWLQEFLAAKAEGGKAPKVNGEVARLAPVAVFYPLRCGRVFAPRYNSNRTAPQCPNNAKKIALNPHIGGSPAGRFRRGAEPRGLDARRPMGRDDSLPGGLAGAYAQPHHEC